jgi:hypothetical protein
MQAQSVVGRNLARAFHGDEFHPPSGLACSRHAQHLKRCHGIKFIKAVEEENLPEHGGLWVLCEMTERKKVRQVLPPLRLFKPA